MKILSHCIFIVSCLIGSATGAAYEITDSFGKHRFDSPPQRVVVTDWAVLEQVLELGIKPIGAPELAAYQHYVQQPALPNSITDIGLRVSPNLKTLQDLKPDLIILGTNQKQLARPFSKIAEVMYYKNFSERYRGNGEKSRERFKQIAELFQKEKVAEQKLATMDTRIAQLRLQLQQHFGNQLPKVTSIRFSSAEKCLVYGDNSLPLFALYLLGIESDFSIKKSQWGEKEIPINELDQIDEGYLVYFKPVNQSDQVFQSKDWLALPVVQQNNVLAASPVWSYGGAMSVLYIAEAISQALLKK
ncbi:MAG: ABC transporter substrate-binding protein [Spongiibacteraceae bacterium]|nr:ABC transporter substrate-binding protein [Spongiibacteraceae bacterium]